MKKSLLMMVLGGVFLMQNTVAETKKLTSVTTKMIDASCNLSSAINAEVAIKIYQGDLAGAYKIRTTLLKDSETYIKKRSKNKEITTGVMIIITETALDPKQIQRAYNDLIVHDKNNLSQTEFQNLVKQFSKNACVAGVKSIIDKK